MRLLRIILGGRLYFLDSFPIQDGKFVAGKDEHNYQEVIADFKNASFIGIVTFNLSQNVSDFL